MKVVVTGGAGFIGANLCRALAAADFVTDVVAFDDLSTGHAATLEGIPARLCEGTILSDADLDRELANAGAVVHLGARPSVPKSIADPMASHEVNATGTAKVLEAIRRHGVGHLVVASSSSVYGANPALPKVETLTPMPVSPYAASKLATEAYAIAWSQSFDLRVLAFRFFNVFGPLQPANHAYAAVIPAFVAAALAGDPLPIHGDGGQTRDFTFVDTVTAVITDALRRKVHSSTPVNLAYGSRLSLLDVARSLEEILGRELPRSHAGPRAGDVRDSQADDSRLKELFPDIAPVPFVEGLRRTVQWFDSCT